MRKIKLTIVENEFEKNQMTICRKFDENDFLRYSDFGYVLETAVKAMLEREMEDIRNDIASKLKTNKERDLNVLQS